MPIRFRCPCGQKLKTQDDTWGRKAKCPNCAKWLRVPKSDDYSMVAEVVESRTRKDKSASRQEKEPAAQNDVSKNIETKHVVLVADSISADRVHTAAILRDHGYTVFEAADGAEALELIRSNRPHAAIVNVRLEAMSGFQMLQQLRNLANTLNKDVWNTPILMTTEKLHGRDKQYAMSLGVEGYFVKPLDPRQVFLRLDRAISKQHPEMANARGNLLHEHAEPPTGN